MKQVALVEVHVVKEQQQIRKELGLWKKEFFLKYNQKVATQNDIAACPRAKLPRGKLKYAKAILCKIRQKE